MAIGQLGMKHPSLAGMVVTLESRISREALHQRFSDEATAFLCRCLGFVLQQKMERVGRLETKLLRPFRRVLIADSSSWDVDEKLRGALPGSGGAASSANCKLQTVYDYKRGEMQFLDVTAGTVPDNRYTSRLPDLLNKGDLILFDLGYFKFATLAAIAKKEAFFLTRLQVSAAIHDPITQASIDLEKRLRQTDLNTYEMDVQMAAGTCPRLSVG